MIILPYIYWLQITYFQWNLLNKVGAKVQCTNRGATTPHLIRHFLLNINYTFIITYKTNGDYILYKNPTSTRITKIQIKISKWSMWSMTRKIIKICMGFSLYPQLTLWQSHYAGYFPPLSSAFLNSCLSFVKLRISTVWNHSSRVRLGWRSWFFNWPILFKFCHWDNLNFSGIKTDILRMKS